MKGTESCQAKIAVNLSKAQGVDLVIALDIPHCNFWTELGCLLVDLFACRIPLLPETDRWGGGNAGETS